MNAMLILRTLYRWFDASVGQVLPARVRLWFKGACLSVARRLAPSRLGAATGVPSLLPDWAYTALREAAIDEPGLLPDILAPYLRRLKMPLGRSPVAEGYGRLWSVLNRAAQHVFILGDEDAGVSDRLVTAIERLALQHAIGILVIWTARSEECLERLPSQVQSINLTALTRIDNAEENALILGRAMIEMKPTTICVASSHAGWIMLRAISGALSGSSRLYAELPAITSRSGVNRGRVAEQSVASGLSKSVRLIANSREIADSWLHCYGIDPASVFAYDYDFFATATQSPA